MNHILICLFTEIIFMKDPIETDPFWTQIESADVSAVALPY